MKANVLTATAEPKADARSPALGRVRAASPHAALAGDEHMIGALAERAMRPVQAKAAPDAGYADLIAAARAARPQRPPPVQRDKGDKPDAGVPEAQHDMSPPAPTKAAPRAAQNWAGTPLVGDDRKAIVTYLGGVNQQRGTTKADRAKAKKTREYDALPIAGAPSAPRRDLKFVLHTTDSPRMSADKLAEHVAVGGMGPLAESPAAYVRSAGDGDGVHPEIAHPRMFEDHRVTSTRWEQALSSPKFETARAELNEKLRAIWDLADHKIREADFSSEFDPYPKEYADAKRALGRLQIEGEIGEIKKGIDKKRFEEGDDKKVNTGAQWAIEKLCRDVVASENDPAKLKAMTASGKDEDAKTLLAKCKEALKIFDDRNARVSKMTNVEIEKVDPKKERPTYSDADLDAVVQLYLVAVLEAGAFPEITTHANVDRGISGSHEDPEDFDLSRLYAKIAVALGHPAGSTYGVAFANEEKAEAQAKAKARAEAKAKAKAEADAKAKARAEEKAKAKAKAK